MVDGRRRLSVHREGAARAFPGPPVLVPGDMGRCSCVRVGTEHAMRETFGSACRRGVVARATGRDALAEEMPEAHRDVRDVVEVVHELGISTRVARLRPVGVVKG